MFALSFKSRCGGFLGEQSEYQQIAIHIRKYRLAGCAHRQKHVNEVRTMRFKGINYDTGFISAGTTTREPFDPQVVKREMQIMHDDPYRFCIRSAGARNRMGIQSGRDIENMASLSGQRTLRIGYTSLPQRFRHSRSGPPRIPEARRRFSFRSQFQYTGELGAQPPSEEKAKFRLDGARSLPLH